MGRKVTLEQFIERAKAVHGDRYDYSKVELVGMHKKVIIICTEHGEFLQEPASHLSGCGCLKCAPSARRKTCLEKYGFGNPLQVPEIFDKKCETMVNRYGVKYALQNSAIQEKCKETCIERYGVDNPHKNKNVVEKTKDTCRKVYGTDNVFQNIEIQERRRQSMISKYGVEYSMHSPEIRKKLKQSLIDHYGVDNPMRSSEIRAKVTSTLVEKYGVEHALQNSEFKGKACQTIRERYGVEHALQSEELLLKSYDTKRKRGTFNSSSSEDILYGMLCDEFGKDDIVRQYNSDDYPFACDFYVKSRNMYIELNAYWMHGQHWFDSNSDEDINTLSELFAKSSGSNQYDGAIHVWTELDVTKRNIARQNRLNYVVFWDSNLNDAELWFDRNCPDGQDWSEIYSWL